MARGQLEQAISLINQGQKAEARPLLLDVLKRDPHDETAWLFLTKTLDDPGEKAEAIKHCLTLNPHSHWAQTELVELQSRFADVETLLPTQDERHAMPFPADAIAEIEAPAKSPSGIDWKKIPQPDPTPSPPPGKKKRKKRRRSAISPARRSRAARGRRRLVIFGLALLLLGLAGGTYFFGVVLPQRGAARAQAAASATAGASAPTQDIETLGPSTTPTSSSAGATFQPSPTPPLNLADPIVLPVRQLTGFPMITAGNVQEMAMLTQWLVDDAVTLDFSPDGTWLAAGTWDGTVRIWSVQSMLSEPWGRDQELYRLDVPFGVNSVAFSPDGSQLAFGMSSRVDQLRIIDLSPLWEGAATQELDLTVLQGHTEGVKSLAFTPDGQYLASSSFDDTVRIWELATRREIGTISDYYVEYLAFAPDGRTLSTSYFDAGYTTFVWDVGRLINGATDPLDALRIMDGGPGLAYAPDGSALAIAEQRITIWASSDIREGADARALGTLLGHRELVQTLAFNPNGSLLASGSRDRSIKLWRTSDGTELNALFGHQKFVRSVVFSPDGRIVASASEDGSIRLWGIPSP